MFLSKIVFLKPLKNNYRYIDFPGYASAYPPLRSLPGIICNTSNIFEHILDIANRIILKKKQYHLSRHGTNAFYLFKNRKNMYL